MVIGAGSSIGREVAHRVVRDGAHVVCVDMNLDAAKATAKEITDQYGVGIGVAGSGISNCGPAIGLACNITDRASVRAMLDEVALAYGGFDSICVTAGVFWPSDTTGHIPDDKWDFTFGVNVKGSYIVGDEAANTWREQSLTGNLILTTSANAVVAKERQRRLRHLQGRRQSSRARTGHRAGSHRARQRRGSGHRGAGSSMFPRDRVIGSLAKYGIKYTERKR